MKMMSVLWPMSHGGVCGWRCVSTRRRRATAGRFLSVTWAWTSESEGTAPWLEHDHRNNTCDVCSTQRHRIKFMYKKKLLFINIRRWDEKHSSPRQQGSCKTNPSLNWWTHLWRIQRKPSLSIHQSQSWAGRWSGSPSSCPSTCWCLKHIISRSWVQTTTTII